MKSFFAKLTAPFEARKIKRENLDGLRSLLQQVVADGNVSDHELQQLSNYTMEFGIEHSETAIIVDEVFVNCVTQTMADRRVTAAEEKVIEHLANRLGVSPVTYQAAKSNMGYYALLHQLETSPFEQIPATWSSSVFLQHGEIDYFSVPATLLEERVVSRQMVGGSHGVSIRIMRGVSYRVGQSRGTMQSTTGIIPISGGEFTITSQRLVFSGDRKSVNAPFPKLQNLEMYSDGLRFSLTNRQKPIMVQFYNAESVELVGMFISRILNR